MGKKALVIGGNGFIGRHVIDECLNKNWEVSNIDKEGQYGPMTYHLDIKSLSIHDIPSLNFSDFHHVYHLAAMAYIEDCWKDPVNAVAVNVGGLCRVLGRIAYSVCSGKNKEWKPRFVYASSMYVYNTASGPYGITKRAAEDLIKWYQGEFGIPYTILRYGTIYGPGAKDNNSMKTLIKRALDTGVISYYGTGEEVREYIYVKDLAEMTVDLAYNQDFENSTVNLTGHHPMKAKDLCLMLRDILGAEYKIEFRKEEWRNDHYMVSPYRYEREVAAKKYVSSHYYDMGAGIMEIISELEKK